jgi:superfamily II DNA or RNA helicase
MNITITRVDGAIQIHPAPTYITSYLQYSHRSFGFQGWRKVNKFEKKELYSVAPNGGVITFAGFFDKLTDRITREHDTPVIEDLRTPVKEPDLAEVKRINWKGIGSTGLRDYQINPIVEFLFKAQAGNGIACCAGGWGKSVLMSVTYAAFQHIGPTIIAVPLKTIFDQLHEKFCKLFPTKHIGRVGGGSHDISSDVTITTYKSLDSCPIEKCKLMLMDEVQCTTGKHIAHTLSGISPVRIFGYTATDKNLFNGADKLIKGLFGERLIYIPYDTAEHEGAVVPCRVYMIRVPEQAAFSANSIDGKLLRGIKRNEIRNRLVGAVCQKVPENWKTLVFVDNIADHLIPLYQYMPEGTIYVHRGQSKEEFGVFALSTKQQDKNLQDYIDGKYKYLLATDALRAGADIPEIKVVVQASGGTSEVELLQEAFRGARTAPGKDFFILIDFLDIHDQTLENMSLKRMEIYKKQNWDVRIIDSIDDIDYLRVGPPIKKEL